MEGFCPLASGSKGNALYFGTKSCKLLIDAGLSSRATCQKLSEIGVSIEEIDAILITHEHGDHIRGLKVLSNKYQIPVFANAETAKGIIHNLGFTPKFKIFSTGETFCYEDVEIHPFRVQHDTLEPVMFTLQNETVKLGVCTDLGLVTTTVRTRLRDCDYLYLEANHEPSMVHACARPMVYKQRVLSRHGHLSNEACGQLLADVAHSGLKHAYLAHLSSECNHPNTALAVVQQQIERLGIQIPLKIAYQDQVSEKTEFI